MQQMTKSSLEGVLLPQSTARTNEIETTCFNTDCLVSYENAINLETGGGLPVI